MLSMVQEKQGLPSKDFKEVSKWKIRNPAVLRWKSLLSYYY